MMPLKQQLLYCSSSSSTSSNDYISRIKLQNKIKCNDEECSTQVNEMFSFSFFKFQIPFYDHVNPVVLNRDAAEPLGAVKNYRGAANL